MAEWSVNDEITAALANQKCIYVGSSAPGTPYDGQWWVDTNTDPSIMKMYDNTNTAWITYMPVYYETDTGAWGNPSQTPVRNGTIVIQYNSTQAGTRIYVYSNSAWVNISTAISPADWREAMIDAMISGADDVQFSANSSLSGYLTYRDVIVDNAKELTITGDQGAIICRTLTNNGTIIKSATGGAGGDNLEGGNGGNGGGMLIIIAKTIDNNGTIKADGADGVNGTTTSQSDRHGAAGGGSVVCLRYSTHTRGAGGAGGGDDEGAAGTGGGGGGGGADPHAFGGDGGSGTYVTLTNAVGLDAYILSTAYAASTMYEYSASGGGEGGAEDASGVGGGGGGGGGCIYVSVGTYDNTGGTIQAIGGAGGNGGSEGGDDNGGGGGGGGIVYVLYETQTAAGTLTVTAGAAGTGDGNGDAGVAGTATAADVY